MYAKVKNSKCQFHKIVNGEFFYNAGNGNWVKTGAFPKIEGYTYETEKSCSGIESKKIAIIEGSFHKKNRKFFTVIGDMVAVELPIEDSCYTKTLICTREEARKYW
jgi:hypothetical protein